MNTFSNRESLQNDEEDFINVGYVEYKNIKGTIEDLNEYRKQDSINKLKQNIKKIKDLKI